MSHYCENCGRTKDDKEFYVSRNIEKYPPDGRLNMCKDCLTMFVDNWDPKTYLSILEQIDVPYIKEEWDKLLEKYGQYPEKMTGTTILGRYLSKMKLKQWSQYRYADSERLAADALEAKVLQMKAQGLSDEDIEQQLAVDRTPPKPKNIATNSPKVQQLPNEPLLPNEEEEDDIGDQLTEEDKLYLRLKWGSSYRPSEWVRMEQLYNDMLESYDIQGAGHKDTLKLICKTSLKANQLIDSGDIEGYQKMSKVYDQLMKSGKFTAAQNKAESGEFVDSVGELVAECEKHGFIPRYYTDGPQDSVDKTLLDLQQYTRNLVTEEMNLGNMIEASLKQIMEDKEREATIDSDDIDDEFESELFDYKENEELEDADYSEYYDSIESDRQADEDLIRKEARG